MTIEMTWRGNPATKKNSQRIVSGGKRSFIVQSQRYKDYERDCLWQIPAETKLRIDTPCNSQVRVLPSDAASCRLVQSSCRDLRHTGQGRCAG